MDLKNKFKFLGLVDKFNKLGIKTKIILALVLIFVLAISISSVFAMIFHLIFTKFGIIICGIIFLVVYFAFKKIRIK